MTACSFNMLCRSEGVARRREAAPWGKSCNCVELEAFSGAHRAMGESLFKIKRFVKRQNAERPTIGPFLQYERFRLIAFDWVKYDVIVDVIITGYAARMSLSIKSGITYQMMLTLMVVLPTGKG